MDIRTSLLTIIIITTASIDIHLTHILTSRQICGGPARYVGISSEEKWVLSVCLSGATPNPFWLGLSKIRRNSKYHKINVRYIVQVKIWEDKWIQGAFIP